MSTACRFDGCTVGDTGRCALEKDPEICPNRVAGVAVSDPDRAPFIEAVGVRGAGDFGAPVLEAPADMPTFPPSTTLGLEMVDEMMASRYVTVVGILGDPESGKTAALASLYLLVSNSQLEGWSFADSRSLRAFEEIARGARRWNEGTPPDQMTVHTEMADERRPGFLHLRLRRDADSRCVDLALPDIPGEWTRALVRTSRSDRLQFLKSADAIWLFVDGRTLNDKVQRQGVITRLGQLAGRLRAFMDGAVPRLLLVLTHRDEGETPADIIERIHAEMTKHEINVDVMPVASFSDDVNFRPGFGLPTLVNATVGGLTSSLNFWPSTQPNPGGRNFLTYRRDR